MLKTIIVILIQFSLVATLNSQASNTLVKNIRAKYNSIKDNLCKYDTIMLELWESTEGGRTIGYYDGNELKMIKVIWLGESGQNRMEYFVDNDQLIFAFEQEFKYNRPLFWNEEENGDDEVFDPRKTTVTENRYYFNEEKLFIWLNDEHKKVDLTSGTNSIVGKGLISDFYKRKDEFKN